jgi:hypothetical protein
VDAYLLANAGLIEVFRAGLQPLFEHMQVKAKEGLVPGQTLRRRPNVGLRLIADGCPLAKLIVLPYWSSRRKHLDCSRLAVELLTEETRRTNTGDAAKKWQKQITLAVSPEKAAAGLIRPSAEADAGRVVETMASFLRDHKAVLARSRDNCAICGRGLSDELSRSRGIGPECIRVAPYFEYLTSRSIIQPEAASPEPAVSGPPPGYLF